MLDTSDHRPEAVSVERIGDEAYVSLCRNVTERETPEGTVFEFDRRVIRAAWTEGLLARVRGDPEAWLARAEETARREPTIRELMAEYDAALMELAAIVAGGE